MIHQHQPKIYFETLGDWFKILGPEYVLAIETWLIERGYVLYRVAQDGGITPTDILQTSENTLAIHQEDIRFTRAASGATLYTTPADREAPARVRAPAHFRKACGT